MKIKLLLIAVLAALSSLPLRAQNAVDWKIDWSASTTNLSNQEYPRVNSERRAQFRIKATDAKDVSVSIGAPLTITKEADGNWLITTSPLDVGFHFFRVLIDGANMTDQATDLIVQLGENQFVIMGAQCRVAFQPNGGNRDKPAQFLTVEEGRYEDGKFKFFRLLNGDEVGWRTITFDAEPALVRLRLTAW